VARETQGETLKTTSEEGNALTSLLYIIPTTHISYLNDEQDSDLPILAGRANNRPDFILFASRELLSEASTVKGINFIQSINASEQHDYYTAVFDILKKVMPSIKLDEIITQFKDDYKNSHSSYTGILKYVGIHQQEDRLEEKQLPNSFSSRSLIAKGGIIFIGLTLFSFLLWSNKIEGTT